MGLPRLAIKHPITTLMVMMICIVLGAVSLTRSPLELMPKINPPIAVVSTAFPGASPQEVATMITQPLEASLATTSGLTAISSTSAEGSSSIQLQFNWGTDMTEVRIDIQERLDRMRLPEGAQKPSILRFNPNMLPVIELTATSGEALSELRLVLEEDVKPRLERIDGVAAVHITGAPSSEIQVVLSQEKLKAAGLTQAQIAQVLQASNLTFPAGNVELNDKSMSLRIIGKTADIDALKRLVISVAPGMPPKPVYLGDVAEVKLTELPRSVINRTNGKLSLRMTVQKEGEANTVTVANAVRAELDKIREANPSLELVTVMDSGEMITKAISNVNMSLVGGGLMAVLVLLFFLRNIRPTLIIGVAIPFSVIVTFVLVYMNKLTINIMTLGGLALGVGMLVDNAIVVIENIYRRMNELDEDPFTASERGAGEVAGAITASTLTTVAVFLPVIFVGGLTGELFRELALTVTFSLVASLAVALTVIPMMAARMLKRQATPAAAQVTAAKGNPYLRLLRWSLKHRAVTLVTAVAMLAGSFVLVPRIGTEFMPTMDEGTFTVNMTMPFGTPLSQTSAKVDELAAIVQQHVDAKVITTGAGAGGNAMGGSSRGAEGGRIKVTLADRTIPTADVMASLRPVLDAARGEAKLTYTVDSGTLSIGGSGARAVQVSVNGPDSVRVQQIVDELSARMSQIPGIVGVTNSMEAAKPELQVVVDQEKAMRMGLAPAQVANTVADAVRGRVATRLESGGRSIDVRVLFQLEERNSLEKLQALPLRTPTGQTVPLFAVAEVKEALGPVSISRTNQKSTVQVSGTLEGRDLGSTTADVRAAIAEMNVGGGYEVRIGGNSQLMSEGFGDLAMALLLAILLIYMIMAAQFESLLYPFTIMFSMPLAIIGVVVGLFVTGYALGITAMIGVIILAGIVVNNGIVLVDFINRRRMEGAELNEAIVEAGRTRLRPILMTAITTMLGLLPLALGLGDGTEMQAPMAVAVIGGLTSATLLTLVVVPVVYHLFTGKRSVVQTEKGLASAAD